MDDLVLQLAGSFHCATSPFSTSAPHPRLESYKQKGEGFGDQDKRRKKAIELQKKRRRDYIDLARRIADGEDVSESEDEEERDSMDSSEKVGKERDSKHGGEDSEMECQSKNRVNPYKNQIMLSEWLVDVSEDFFHSWLFVVCPIGRRCLVVAARQWTAAYARNGHCLRRFPSNLPGGNKRSGYGKYTILDCIFNEVDGVFYVLDLMCWNNHVFYDSDRECRYFLLDSKLSEEGEAVGMKSSRNPLPFQLLVQRPCTKEDLEVVLSKAHPVPVDGLLFFHKQGHYVRRLSPLCTWLKPHMVPDILRVPVSQEFLDSAPVLEKKVWKEGARKDKRTACKEMET